MSTRHLLFTGLIAFVFASISFGLSGPVSGMEFVSIPDGSFQMGSPVPEFDRDEDELQHLVNIESFELMTTEVTQGMWEEVMGEDFQEFCANGNSNWSPQGVGSNYPVYYVSWNDCNDFIDKLNQLDYNYTYRLPSESEWEYACRAGTMLCYYWGDNYLKSKMGQYCWYFLNSDFSTYPVAEKLPNLWGLYDMSGNVIEWCSDYYISDYSKCPQTGAAYIGTGSLRVARGGSYGDYPGVCRSASRLNFNSSTRLRILGFRLVRSEL